MVGLTFGMTKILHNCWSHWVYLSQMEESTVVMVNGVIGQSAQANAVQMVERRLDELEDATLQPR